MNTGLKTVKYVDAKLDLDNRIMELYRKRNCELRYINIKSNHSRHIIEKIPIGIEHRLSHNSSSESIFKNIKHDNQSALQVECCNKIKISKCQAN